MNLQPCKKSCADLLVLLALYRHDVYAVRIGSEVVTSSNQVELSTRTMMNTLSVAEGVIKMEANRGEALHKRFASGNSLKQGLTSQGEALHKTSAISNTSAQGHEANRGLASTTLSTMWIQYVVRPLMMTSAPKTIVCLICWACLKVLGFLFQKSLGDTPLKHGSKKEQIKENRIAEAVESESTDAGDDSSESEVEDDVMSGSDNDVSPTSLQVAGRRSSTDYWENLTRQISGSAHIFEDLSKEQIEKSLGRISGQDCFLSISARYLCLAWWADKEAFTVGKEPLGGIECENISSVREEKSILGSPAVVVWHWRDDENTRLNILFSSLEAAEIFRHALTEFLEELLLRSRQTARKSKLLQTP